MITFEAELKLNGGNIQTIPDSIQKQYIRRYSEIVDLINQRLENWNSMWDKYCGDDSLEEGTTIWNIYGQFLAMNERKICLENNLRNVQSPLIMDAIADHGDPKIIGILNGNPNNYLHIEVKR